MVSASVPITCYRLHGPVSQVVCLARTMEIRGPFRVKRNTVVLGIALLLLVVFAWAGWANWEYRKQAAEKRLASAAKAELVTASAAGDGDIQHFSSPLL